MPEKQRPKISKYDLITGVDSYATQTSQNPETARFLQSWIPGDDGGLYREWNDPALGTGLPARAVKRLFEFDWIGPTSNLVRFFFAVVKNSGSGYTLWSYSAGTWSQVTAVGTLANIPSFARVQSTSLLHLSDGVTNWLFDGTNWIADGIQIPLGAPTFSLGGSAWRPGTAYPGTINISSLIIDPNGNVQAATSSGTSGSTIPTNWGTVPGATTTDNSITWTCLGVPTLWQPGNAYTQWQSIYDTHGNIQQVSVAGTSGSNTPNWSVSGNTTDGGVTWEFWGKLVNPGQFTYPYLFVDGEWGPGMVLPGGHVTFVLDPNGNVQMANSGTTSTSAYPKWNTAQGGTTTDATVTWTNLGPLATFPVWQPSFVYSSGSFVIDSNGNFQENSGGTSGTTQPTWNPLFEQTTSDNSVTWTNRGYVASGQAILAAVGKFYWYTNADHTVPRVHESSSSQISGVGTGALPYASVRVFQQGGQFTSNSSSPTVTSAIGGFSGKPNLDTLMAGQVLYLHGKLIGTIASVNLQNQSITLTANATSSEVNASAVICDARCTHWHVYASESDGSKIGELLMEIPVTANLDLLQGAWDTSPFVGFPGEQYTTIFRPVRNDPPVTSLLAEVHKYRIFRRREARPNFFNYTANEEVSSGLNGDPTESTPGADVNTLSDIVNEQVYPDASNFIRAMCSHGDALYIGTEKQTLPLYGQSIDDFGLSQVTAFSLGIAGRRAMISTAHGLAFVSYDKKVFLYPTSNYYWAYVPNDVNVTDNLVEIGKPLRKILEQINPAALDETELTFYFFGRRNWLVLTFQDNTTAYQTWVYDFQNKGWFQLAVGYSSMAVFEIATGQKVLVGGNPAGGVFVVDDLNGVFTSTGNQPQSIWRPALIDFGDPDSKHIPLYIEIEFSNALMANDLTLNYYLDPVNVDSPGTPRSVILEQVLGANVFRGFFQGGNLCQRLLIEFNAAASPVSTNSGFLRGVKLVANPASGLIK